MGLDKKIRKHNLALTADHNYGAVRNRGPAETVAEGLGLLSPILKRLSYPSYRSREPDAVCSVIVVPHPVNAAVLIEVKDNRGTSVTNRAALLGTFIRHDWIDELQSDPLFIECYYEFPPEFETTYDQMVFGWEEGVVQSVDWRPCGAGRTTDDARTLLQEHRHKNISP